MSLKPTAILGKINKDSMSDLLPFVIAFYFFIASSHQVRDFFIISFHFIESDKHVEAGKHSSAFGGGTERSLNALYALNIRQHGININRSNKFTLCKELIFVVTTKQNTQH